MSKLKKQMKIIIPASFSPTLGFSIEDFLKNTEILESPFLSIMGARFWHAAKYSSFGDLSCIESMPTESDTWYFIRDLFLNQINKSEY